MKNIVIQITPDQHESEERFLIGYIDAEGKPSTKIVNYADLTSTEKTAYTKFKATAEGYIPQ